MRRSVPAGLAAVAGALLWSGLCSARQTPPGPFAELEKAVETFDRATLPKHPRMVLTPAEMTRVREAARSEWGRPYWQIIRNYVDAGRAREVPAEPPGYKDGNWNVEDWRRIVNVGDEYQSRMLAASFAAVVTGDQKDVDEAKRWALAAAKLDPKGMTGITGVDHPARDILHGMALSYDWLYDRYTTDERAALRDCMLARGREMFKYLKPYRGDSWNNHPWFQTSALVETGLALADEVEEADAWWRYGSRLFLTDFLTKGGRDGDWHEGSKYVSYTMMFVYQWADALKTATGIDGYTIPWLQNVGLFQLYISPPGGAGIQFNDNNMTPPNLLDKYCAYQAARTTGSGVLQWYGDQIPLSPTEVTPRQPISILIAHDPRIEASPPGRDLPLGVWYRDSGWAVMRTDLSRSDDVQFGLKGGKWYGSPKSRGHDHPDQNGFLLNYGGEPLAVDSGYYDYYGSPHHNNWTFTGRAHNTILVDGKEQLVRKDGQILSFISDRDGMDFVEAEAAGAYEDGLLRSWRRQVLFIRPDVFLIRDIVTPTKPSTVSWLLHGPKQFEVDGQQMRVNNGSATLVAEMVEPTGLKLEQTVGFPDNAQPERKTPGQFPDQAHLSMATDAKAEEHRFVFMMRPGREGVERPVVRAASQDGSPGYAVTADGATTTVQFLEPSAAAERRDIVARVFAERPLDGTRATTLLSAATRMELHGQLWWQSSVPADVSGVRDSLMGWVRVSVRLEEPADIRIRIGREARVLVDGKEMPLTYDQSSSTASLSLPKGTHILHVR